jgi:2-oxo-3-hexenedioate decarboxylase
MSDEQQVRELAERLDTAARERSTTKPLSADTELDTATAYRVQEALVGLRVARGARVVGGKLGLTSKAKQIAMGVHEPLYGLVTSDMVLPSGGVLPLEQLIHPRVEPEVAFVLNAPVAGPGATAADVLAATGYVCVALDVIDSRYDGFSFTHVDAIADNGSSSVFALGNDLVAPTMDLALAACVLEVDGEVTDSAAGAAVMGHPATAVAFMANALATVGKRLEAGWVVLSGGLTAPVAMSPGRTVTATVAGIGSVTLTAG